MTTMATDASPFSPTGTVPAAMHTTNIYRPCSTHKGTPRPRSRSHSSVSASTSVNEDEDEDEDEQEDSLINKPVDDSRPVQVLNMLDRIFSCVQILLHEYYIKLLRLLKYTNGSI